MNKTHCYGWNHPTVDARDEAHRYRPRVVRLPKSVAPLTAAIPAWDQGQLGSCVAHGCGRIWAHRRAVELQVQEMPARLFVYYGARVLEGSVHEDAGAEVRDGLKSLAKWGCPDERLWPYVISRFTQKPNAAAFKAALKDIALEYQTLTPTLTNVQLALAAGNPVVFGFDVYPYFESEAMAATGILKLPGKRETPVGGHCVAFDGYDSSGRLWVANSWGQSWGLAPVSGAERGWFKMPAAYLKFCSDAWVLTRVS